MANPAHLAVSNEPPPEAPTGALAEWKAHWPMVLAAMVGMSLYSVVSYSFGTFVGPLEQEFGWDRATLSFGLTIFAVIATLGGPFVGALLDKVGTRTIAIAGVLAISAAIAAFSTADGSVGQWMVLWVVYGVASIFTKSTLWSAGVSSVFNRSRGMALAAMLSGAALGQAFAPLIANYLIEAHGWRAAYQWLGGGWGAGALVLVVLFYRDARTRGGAARPAVRLVLPGLTMREGLRDIRIVRIALANVLLAIVGSAITLHLVPLITETGLPKSRAVEIAATAGLAGLAGKFIAGWLLDRWTGSLLPVAGIGIAMVSDVLFLSFHNPAALTVAAMILGLASGATLQISTYLVSRYAGMRAFGSLFGTIASAMMLGTSIGPLLAGAIHDRYGSYDPLLMAAIPVTFVAAMLMFRLGPYPTFSPVVAVEGETSAAISEGAR